jgi:hypothetical protein
MAQQFCRVMQQENEAREQRQQEATREMTERPGTRGRTVVHTQEQVRRAGCPCGVPMRGARLWGPAAGRGFTMWCTRRVPPPRSQGEAFVRRVALCGAACGAP